MSPLRGLSRVSPYFLPIRLSFAYRYSVLPFYFIIYYLLFYLNTSPYLSYYPYPAFLFPFHATNFRNKLPFHLSGHGPPTSAYLNPHINPSDGHSNTSATQGHGDILQCWVRRPHD